MRGTDSRKGTGQFLFTGTEHLRHRRSSQSKIVKRGPEDLVRHAVSLNPSDLLTVLYGHPVVSSIALQALVDRALSGHPVVYLDAVHTFDAFLIGRLARSRRQQPRKALAMIHVARAFSARQLERLMSHCLADALERYQASTAMISGLFETLSADGLTDNEVSRLADRMIESVRHLTQQGFSLLCPCPVVPMPVAPSHRLFAMLCSMSDRCVHVHELQGKIVTEELSLNAMPASADLCEAVDTSHPSPSNLPASALQFSHAPVAQLDRAAVS
jgi:hypothetical protein